MQDETLMRRWIAEREPADARLPIARNVVYTFHARVAERWRLDRVFLAGDAAHLSPPFAGQGMNSGVRDATNLAWKLAAVVQGRLASSVLDSYETERKPHARALIHMAERIGTFMQPKSRLGAMFSQGLLKLISLYAPARDYVMQLKFKPQPRFTEGCFIPAPSQALLPAGQLLPQPWVELRSGKRVRLDDVLGNGFALLRWASAPPPSALSDFPVRDVQLLPQNDDFLLERARNPNVVVVRDCEGVLGPLLKSAGAEAMLLRPDRYVMAYLPRSAMLKNLIALKHPFFKLNTSN
jgi:3-(3-hydroxy-phenyl)propionate hydroxylase